MFGLRNFFTPCQVNALFATPPTWFTDTFLSFHPPNFLYCPQFCKYSLNGSHLPIYDFIVINKTADQYFDRDFCLLSFFFKLLIFIYIQVYTSFTVTIEGCSICFINQHSIWHFQSFQLPNVLSWYRFGTWMCLCNF